MKTIFEATTISKKNLKSTIYYTNKISTIPGSNATFTIPISQLNTIKSSKITIIIRTTPKSIPYSKITNVILNSNQIITLPSSKIKSTIVSANQTNMTSTKVINTILSSKIFNTISISINKNPVIISIIPNSIKKTTEEIINTTPSTIPGNNTNSSSAIPIINNKSSSKLSAGVIAAIAIPCIAALLGITLAAFLLKGSKATATVAPPFESTIPAPNYVDTSSLAKINVPQEIVKPVNTPQIIESQPIQPAQIVKTEIQPIIQTQSVKMPPVQQVQMPPVQQVQMVPVQQVQMVPVQQVQMVPVQEIQMVPVEEIQMVPVEEVQMVPVQEIQMVPVQEITTVEQVPQVTHVKNVTSGTEFLS